MPEGQSSGGFFRETGIATFSGATGGAASEIFAIWEVPAQVVCNCATVASTHIPTLNMQTTRATVTAAETGGPEWVLVLSQVGLAVLVGGLAGTALGGLALLAYRRWGKRPGKRSVKARA